MPGHSAAHNRIKVTDGTDVADVSPLTDASDNIDGLYGVVGASAIFGRVSDTIVSPVPLDSSTNSLMTVAYEHHEVHSGSHFFVVNYQDLSINNVLDFTWLMPNTTKWTHLTWSLVTEAETLWQVYEGAVATNPLANAVTPRNNNRNSATTSGTTMKFELQTNLAAANADTDVSGATLLEQGISGAGRASGNAMRTNEIILKQNTLYCLRATATAAGYINFDMQWYEHTNKH